MGVIKKKSIFLSLTAIFAVALFVYSGVASSVSAAYAPLNGDVIKIDSVDRPAVYYIQNGKRYLFVNRVTYTTWASSVGDAGDSFYTLRKISQADFDKIPVGGNLTIKPGSKLIKFDDSNIVYAVGLGAKLYKLSDEAAKTALYGNIAPVIIQSSFRANYYDNGNAVATLTSNSQKPEGIVGMADPANGTDVTGTIRLKSDLIRQAFAEKYNRSISEITVTIAQENENYARGGVKFGVGGAGEGGFFFAAKVGGLWKIISDGNGVVDCNALKTYNFPSSMATDCSNL